MSRRKGVTLIELLIAMTLLSLLVGSILTALRVGLNALDKVNAKLMMNRRAISAQRILASEIGGLMPVAGEFAPAPGAPPSRFLFFQGDPETMRFVSSYSLREAGRGYPQILEFQVMPGEKAGVRLIVNELLYTGPASGNQVCLGFTQDPATGMQRTRFRPVEAGPRSFVLADRLAYCRFLYQEIPQQPGPPARWLSEWVRPEWPKAVRIEMGPLEPDPTRVLPATLTMPVRPARKLDEDYSK
jgi:prepilin-type N-terminal cleavage/methylation domain-containing protein